MQNLTIYNGPFQQYYHFKNEILEHVRTGSDNYLALLPVNRAVRLLKKKLVDSAPNTVLVDPPVFTFDQILLELYLQLPSPKKVLTADLLSLIIDELIKSQANQLNYLCRDGVVKKGLSQRIADNLLELRRFGFEATGFAEDCANTEGISEEKYKDFQFLLSVFEQQMGSNYIDQPFACHFAARSLTENLLYKRLPSVKEIYISGYGLFTPAMYLFIEAASKWTKVNIKIDYLEQNTDLFGQTQPVIERFKKMGAQFIQTDEDSKLAISLFNRKKNIAERIKLNKSILKIPAENREQEINQIAATIRQLSEERNIPLHRFAVTFPNMETYIPLIRSVFTDFELPINLSTGFKLYQSPLIQSFLRCLKIIEGGFEYKSVFQFLNSPYSDLWKNVNLDHIQRMVIKQRIRYLSPGWESRLLKLLTKLQHSADESEDTIQAINKTVERLEPLYNFPKKLTVLEFRKYYIQLLKKLGYLDWYNLDNHHLSARQKENEFRAFNSFMKLIEKLIWILEQIYGQSEQPLSVYIEKLDYVVSTMTYNLTEWPDYGVQIMPRLEIQAVEYDVLFVGGLVDGDFPRGLTRDIFFNDKIRSQIGLLASEELLDQDRFIFYSLLESNAEEIYLTYPCYEEDRALVHSTFISELEELLDGGLTEFFIGGQVKETASKNWETAGLYLQSNSFNEAFSLFSNLLHNPNPEQKLLQINQVLNKINSARMRLAGKQFSIFEGLLSDSHLVNGLLKNQFKQKTWSATMLEEYAACPMQFYLDRILKIEDTPPFEENLTALERGDIIHRILFEFYQKLNEADAATEPLAHKALLFQLAEKAFDMLPVKGFFARLEQQKFFTSENGQNVFGQFLEVDQIYIDQSGYRPALFELSFGYSSRREKDDRSVSKPVFLIHDSGSLNLSGSIDRVDICDERAAIFDYKTGSSGSQTKTQAVLEGRSLQLPLYMLAVNKLFPKLQAIYAAFYDLSKIENVAQRPLLADIKSSGIDFNNRSAGLPNKYVLDEDGKQLTLDEVLSKSLEQALKVVEQIQEGIFHHTLHPTEAFCQSYCQYRRMCQKNVGKLMKISE